MIEQPLTHPPLSTGMNARLLLIGLCLTLSTAAQTPPDIAKAQWIWDHSQAINEGTSVIFFRRTVELPAKPKRAVVLITADNGYELSVNGSLLGGETGFDARIWKSVEQFDVTNLMVAGKNAFAVKGKNLAGPAGLLVAIRIEQADGKTLDFVSDKSWKFTTVEDANWAAAAADDTAWKSAVELGGNGMVPWGKVVFGAAAGGGKNVQTVPPATMSEPAADFVYPTGVLFLRGRLPATSSPMPQSIWPMHGSRAYLEHDVPGPAVTGRQLWSLTPARPEGKVQLVHDAGRGVIGSPRVSFDGQQIFFAMAPEGEKFFHIFRLDTRTKKLTQLTTGPFHDYDPEPLPDGSLLFSSTRIGNREEYHGNIASSLFSLSVDGKSIRPFTHHIVADREPRVLADGSIAFVRSDNFLERAKVETQIHMVRPDGSGGQVLLGADRGAIVYDRSRAAEQDARWLRSYGFGSPAALPDGRVAAISHMGLVVSGDATAPRKLDAPFVPFDISPLPDGRLLCSSPSFDGVGVYDFDTAKITRIYTSPVKDVHSVAFFGPRTAPPIATGVTTPKYDDQTGYLLCQNVFTTKQTQADLKRIKGVRVFEGRPLGLRSARHPYDHIGVEAVELGSVPLAADGSFYVKVPANRPLAMQAIDAEGRAVINEMSWIYVAPGERRTCVGCHSPRETAPSPAAVLAARAGAIPLLGDANPHRFRGNNAANGGVLNLQLDRFREVAAINLYGSDRIAGPGRSHDVILAIQQLKSDDPAARISAARRLAIYRDRAASAPLAQLLADKQSEVRLAAVLALAACGTRESVKPLVSSLEDVHPLVVQGAINALEHLTGHHPTDYTAWRAFIDDLVWEKHEAALMRRLDDKEPLVVHEAIEALGHIGDAAGRDALRQYLADHPDGELRILMATIRALGHLRDEQSIPLLSKLLESAKTQAPGKGFHETGFLQKPVYLGATSAEALGWIGGPDAEKALLASMASLGDFWTYSYRTADHTWLMGSHSSPVHYRILEALDALGTRELGEAVPLILRSIPIDSDRGLLLENDAYETLAARVIHRSGVETKVLQTCLSILGDSSITPTAELKAAIVASPPAVSTGILDPESRAAQLLSVFTHDKSLAAQTRAALERYLAMRVDRKRSWTAFMLARALGKTGDEQAIPLLESILKAQPTETSLGLETPPHFFTHQTMTPMPRAAAAWSYARLAGDRSPPLLIDTIQNLDNAIDVRWSAARGLMMAAPQGVQNQTWIEQYPEVGVRHVLRTR